MRYRYFQPAGVRSFFDPEYDTFEEVPFRLVYEDNAPDMTISDLLAALPAAHNVDDRPRRFEIRSMTAGDLIEVEAEAHSSLFQIGRLGEDQRIEPAMVRRIEPERWDFRHLSQDLLREELLGATEAFAGGAGEDSHLAALFAEVLRRRSVAAGGRPVSSEAQAILAERWSQQILRALRDIH